MPGVGGEGLLAESPLDLTLKQPYPTPADLNLVLLPGSNPHIPNL